MCIKELNNWQSYFLLNKYLHVTVLFGIIKQITHGSEGTVTLTAMCYLYNIINNISENGLYLRCGTQIWG